jgi:hypothetical protein
MLIYTVHEPAQPDKDLQKRAEAVVFVREGFTWLGFFFPPIWLLAKRLWLEFIALLLIGAGVAMMFASLGARTEGATVANLLACLIVGFQGNDLVRWKLSRRGFNLVAAVAGRSFDECERRFFDAWLPQAARDSESGGTPISFPITQPPKANPVSWKPSGAIGTFPDATA